MCHAYESATSSGCPELIPHNLEHRYDDLLCGTGEVAMWSVESVMLGKLERADRNRDHGGVSRVLADEGEYEAKSSPVLP